ncbi:MAG: hypothetical protein ACLP1X_28825 [Polyangiaceae bacterium]
MTVRQVSSLRAALATHEPARGKRYRVELKTRIIELAQSHRREGASWVPIGADVGIAFETLRRWCLAAEAKPSRALVPVRVVADRAERTVSVVSAGGHRVEGLTLHEAAAVLRALGCGAR